MTMSLIESPRHNLATHETGRRPENNPFAVDVGYLSLTEQGRARVSYADGLLKAYFKETDLEKKKEIKNHLEYVSNPDYSKYKIADEIIPFYATIGNMLLLTNGNLGVRSVLPNEVSFYNWLNFKTTIKTLENKKWPTDYQVLLNDKILVWTSEESYIYDVNTESKIDTYNFTEFPSVLPDGNILTAEYRKQPRIYNQNSGEKKLDFEGEFSEPVILSNGNLLTLSGNNTFNIYDSNTGKLIEDDVLTKYNLNDNEKFIQTNNVKALPQQGFYVRRKSLDNLNMEACFVDTRNHTTIRHSNTELYRVLDNGQMITFSGEGEMTILDPNTSKKNLLHGGFFRTITEALFGSKIINIDAKLRNVSIIDLQGNSMLSLENEVPIISFVQLPNGTLLFDNGKELSLFRDPNINYKKFYDIAFPKK